MVKTKKKLVSIIIVNWNGGEVFRDCLKSLDKIKYPSWELIVVDNASIDGSDKYTGKKKLTLIKNSSNLGFATGNNQGFAKSKGDYILLLNNDTKVPPDFLDILVDKLEKDKSIAAVQPKIYLMDEKELLDNCGSFLTRIGFLEHWGFFKKDSEEFNKEKIIFSAKGACMLIRRRVVEEVGLFDDAFGSYFEETDFCWRVWMAGYKIIYYPKTFIFHKLAYSAKRMNPFTVNYHSFKNRIASLIKNLGLIDLIIILPIHILVLKILVLYYLLKGRFGEAKIIFKAIFWNIFNLPQILIKRFEVQKMRKRTDSQIFKFILHPINISGYLYSLKRLNSDLKS